jgi:hypothetical protein
MNYKKYRRRWSWPNSKVLSWHMPGGTEENHNILSQNNRSPGKNVNLGPPEYEVGVLTTQP